MKQQSIITSRQNKLEKAIPSHFKPPKPTPKMTPTPIDPTPTLDAPERVKALLQRLHTASLAQEAELSQTSGPATVLDNDATPLSTQHSSSSSSSSPSSSEAQRRRFDDLMRDKMIALEQDKALFVYHLCRALRATRVVEAGTSFGISTIYLALAVGQNVAVAAGGEAKGAKVIATENEPGKIARARAHWREAGEEVERWIELREGDLRQTLAEGLSEEIDFVLFDSEWALFILPFSPFFSFLNTPHYLDEIVGFD